jgi:uncharacterized phage protein (TIGR01671 family)
MREIKFRGKNEYDKWEYGTGLIQYKTGEIGILNNFSKYGREATEMLNRTNVIPKTLGQYTGEKDKNGKEIYEGDIAKKETFDYKKPNFRNISYAKIKYVDELTGFFLVNKENKIYYSLGVDKYNIEVIGNIYDNPELLED